MSAPDPRGEGARLAHGLFLLTLAGKGLIGVVQLAIAGAIRFGAADRLPDAARWFFDGELAEDPTDFLANAVLSRVGPLASADLGFYEVYFAVHGLLHVGVVAALLAGASWAYPAAIAVLAAFVVYQAAEWLHVGGPMLPVLTAIDLAVIWLTWLEWRRRTR